MRDDTRTGQQWFGDGVTGVTAMRASVLVLLVGVASGMGCAPGAEGDGSGGAGAVGGAAGFGGGAGFGGVGGGGGGACLTFETQPCMCDATLSGRRVCSAGVWSDCACDGFAAAGSGGTGGSGGSGGGDVPVSEPLANKNPNVMWTWTETAPSGSCRAGHYEGTFSGLYASSLTVVGAPIPVFALDATGAPGLEFDLVQAPGGGEIFKVENGKMRGTALGAFPFTFDMEGELDCSTLKFNALLLNGFYWVGTIMVPMSGPITADYDPVTASISNGHWIVTEPGSMPPWGSTTPWYGGEGDWSANFIHP